MKSLVYPSELFKEECMAAIASGTSLTVQVLPGPKVGPMSRYMARITQTPNQPPLLLSLIDNFRVDDFVIGIAEALQAEWKFSYIADDPGLTILIERGL
jgi:hypothetical protein